MCSQKLTTRAYISCDYTAHNEYQDDSNIYTGKPNKLYVVVFT